MAGFMENARETFREVAVTQYLVVTRLEGEHTGEFTHGPNNVWHQVALPRPTSEMIIKVQKKMETPFDYNRLISGVIGRGWGADSSLFMGTRVSIWAPGGHLPLLCLCSEWIDVYTCCHLDASHWLGSLFAKPNAYLTCPEMTPVPCQAVTTRRRFVQIKD